MSTANMPWRAERAHTSRSAMTRQHTNLLRASSMPAVGCYKRGSRAPGTRPRRLHEPTDQRCRMVVLLPRCAGHPRGPCFHPSRCRREDPVVCAALRTSAAAVIVEQKKLDEYVIHAGCSLIPFGLELNPVESCGYLGPLGLDEWRALHKIMPSNGGLREDDARRGLGLDSTGIVDHDDTNSIVL